MSNLNWGLPENAKVVLCYQGAANVVDCDVVSMKYFHKGYFVVVHTGANDTDLVLSLYEATTVGKGATAPVTTACPIWLDADAGTTSDLIARTTDGYSVTIDPATQNGVVWIIEVDPSILSDGYPCIYLADSAGNGSNICTILFVGLPRFSGEVLPVAITD